MKNTYSKRKGAKKTFEVYRDIHDLDEKPSKEDRLFYGLFIGVNYGGSEQWGRRDESTVLNDTTNQLSLSELKDKKDEFATSTPKSAEKAPRSYDELQKVCADEEDDICILKPKRNSG
ncbi:hypothetical protein TRICI_002314 [Trichomonascus ciferrii]|uniref:Uncharacterized protein n=1 Tax=Trichomonascus ciferrii TaxID=44093 RepID=A0A642V7A5_9ASCO|nr:hypothetical protein TRICI_002314 [Trichomonascus ciferrii]